MYIISYRRSLKAPRGRAGWVGSWISRGPWCTESEFHVRPIEPACPVDCRALREWVVLIRDNTAVSIQDERNDPNLKRILYAPSSNLPMMESTSTFSVISAMAVWVSRVKIYKIEKGKGKREKAKMKNRGEQKDITKKSFSSRSHVPIPPRARAPQMARILFPGLRGSPGQTRIEYGFKGKLTVKESGWMD